MLDFHPSGERFGYLLYIIHGPTIKNAVCQKPLPFGSEARSQIGNEAVESRKDGGRFGEPHPFRTRQKSYIPIVSARDERQMGLRITPLHPVDKAKPGNSENETRSELPAGIVYAQEKED